MREDIAGPQGTSSRPIWETLEGMVREKVQEFIQQIMEEEVTELLGREKSERRSAVDAAAGYRNGYGKPRRLAMSSGTITLRRPRVRGVEERFESRVLPLFARRTKELGALLPELYLHGLAEGDFELAMRGLLGEGAPLSKSSIRRLRAGWTAEFEAWSRRSLADREVVYVWADGIYVKAGLERDKAALLVVMGAMRDGTKEVLAIAPGYRESTECGSGPSNGSLDQTPQSARHRPPHPSPPLRHALGPVPPSGGPSAPASPRRGRSRDAPRPDRPTRRHRTPWA